MEIFSSVNKAAEERAACSPSSHSLNCSFTDFSVPVQHIYLKLLIIEIKCYRWKKAGENLVNGSHQCHLVTALLCFPLLSNGLVFGSIFSLSIVDIFFCFLFCLFAVLLLPLPIQYAFHLLLVTISHCLFSV